MVKKWSIFGVENALFLREMEVPDPYHGGTTMSAPSPPHPLPRVHPPRALAMVSVVSGACSVSDPLWEAHQASSGYSQKPKIQNCLKLPLFDVISGHVKTDTFCRKCLPNPHMFYEKCHFWRFWPFFMILDHSETPLVYHWFLMFLRYQVFPRSLAKSEKYIYFTKIISFWRKSSKCHRQTWPPEKCKNHSKKHEKQSILPKASRIR